MDEGEGEIMTEGKYAGWTKADVQKLGDESERELKSLRETWKVIKEDDTKTAFDTGGGIYVEEKATGRLTRVGDSVVPNTDKQ